MVVLRDINVTGKQNQSWCWCRCIALILNIFYCRHHRQGYEDDEHSEKFSQQSYKDRHGTSYSGSSHHYHKTSVEGGGRSGSSECEDVKKEKHSKSKQHGDKESRDDYSKEKRSKTSKPDKQPEYSDIIEGLSDAEDVRHSLFLCTQFYCVCVHRQACQVYWMI